MLIGGLPAIAIAYPYYSRKLNILRFSVSCHWFLKGNEHGVLDRLEHVQCLFVAERRVINDVYAVAHAHLHRFGATSMGRHTLSARLRDKPT